MPPGDWRVWLILAGRGFGKTRTGAETVRQWVKRYPLVNLMGATADDARDIMIEGESGILATCPKDERPTYVANKAQLQWPNGAKSLVFTADSPERLRGKQHMKLWADELCAWRYQESWDQAMFGLRLGDAPQAIVTTTPKPTLLLRNLTKDPQTFVTRGSTFDNKANLADAFIGQILSKYEGTRLGRQEIDGEVLDDYAGALWSRGNLDLNRIGVGPVAPREVPQLRRVVVAIDPAATATEESDETGLIVAGVGMDGRGYVLEDRSGRYTPEGWAREAIALYKRWSADRIVAEVNNGGDMVEATIRMVDRTVSYKSVRASRGKVIRAEPVAALYEQDKVSHVKTGLATLEDQMCQFSADFDRKAAGYSPDRVDALVWALTELMVEDDNSGAIRDFYANLSAEAQQASKDQQ